MLKIDGRAIARKIIGELKARPVPKKILAAVFVGTSPASESFLKIKESIAEELGVNFQLFQLAEVVNQEEVEDMIRGLSHNNEVGGIIVQLPLPKRLDRERVLNYINPKKDIDALTSKAEVISPVVGVVEEILKHIGWNLENKTVAVVGRGRLVGQPTLRWLEQQAKKLENLKVKSVDMEIENLREFLADADLVVSGVGNSSANGLIKSEWLKEGASVIDFGFPPDLDVSNEESLNKLGFYTPTPGGTGPVLIAKLFDNFYKLNS